MSDPDSVDGREHEILWINSTIEKLAAQLNEPVMKSSARLTILIALALNKKLNFTEILGLTSLGKGSLSNHLDRLHEKGLVEIRTVFRPSGPGKIVLITEPGMEVYRNYTELLRKLISMDI